MAPWVALANVIASICDSTAAASLRANLTASSARLDRDRSRKRPNTATPVPITTTSRKVRSSLIFSTAEPSNYRTILYDIKDDGAPSAIKEHYAQAFEAPAASCQR